MNDYEGVRRVFYGDENFTFLPVHEGCGMFVKPDDEISYVINGLDEIKKFEPNATCKKHGRVVMIFEGYY